MRSAAFVTATIIGVVTLVSGLGAQEATIQAEAHCDRCHQAAYEVEGGGTEMMHIFGDAGWWNPGRSMDCHAFNACHGNPQSGTCTEFHFDCGSTALLRMIDNAVDRRDASLLEAIMSANNQVVTLTPDAIMLRNCAGDVDAVRPLNGNWLAHLVS